MNHRLIVIAGLLGVAGCGTYNYNRAALVPHIAPHLDTGQPLDRRGQLDLGASSVAHLGKPGVGDPEAGIEIPGTQLHGGLKVGVNDKLTLGVIYENGFDSTAHPLKSTQPKVDNGNVVGYGFSVDVSIPTSTPGFRVGLGFEAIEWEAPYVEYETCQQQDACFPYLIQDEGKDGVMTAAIALTPSYRTGEFTVFGGATVRNHPTLVQKGVETDPLFNSPDVESGPFNVVLSAGGEYSIANGAVKLSAIGYWDVSQKPAKYGPGLAAMVSIPFGRSMKRAPAPPAPAYPQSPYPPAPYPPAPYPPPVYTPPPPPPAPPAPPPPPSSGPVLSPPP